MMGGRMCTFLNKPKKKVLQFNNKTKIKENGFVKIIHM